MSRRSLASFLAIAAAAISMGTASLATAAKRPTAPAASITLLTADPHLGGYVSFAYVTAARDPRIAVRCYQNGVMTYAEAGSAGQAFLLGGAGSDWQRAGGAAHCTAELFSIEWKPNQPQQVTMHATTEFDAAG